jgi:hypothetical protein
MLSERSGSAIVVSLTGSYCGSSSLYRSHHHPCLRISSS